MGLSFRKLHPTFVAEVSPVDLRRVHDRDTLAQIRAGMDEFAVLVFHDQPFTDEEHLAFAQRLDGELHTGRAPPPWARAGWATRRSRTSRTSTRTATSRT
jgi:alpha-ketoglutarate-dependent taurine dioxygenase